MSTSTERRLLGPAPPNPYGAFAAVDGLGGTAAPLLAGFSIALLALVMGSASSVRWPDLALALLAVAVVMFLQVVQLNARARGYAVTPAQVREWYADLDDPGRQAVLEQELRHHRACWAYLVRRTRLRYNLGILALLLATAAVLVPSGAMHPWRWIAIAVVAAGVGIEVLEIVESQAKRSRRPAGRLRRALQWLAPANPPVPPRYESQPVQPPRPAAGSESSPSQTPS